MFSELTLEISATVEPGDRLLIGTCQRGTKKAGLHAYRVQVVHGLKEPDSEKRMHYCQWFQAGQRTAFSTRQRTKAHSLFSICNLRNCVI